MFFRAILELIVAVLVLSIVRSVIGTILKAFSGSSPSAGAQVPRPPSATPAGELKRDPVCGTFIAAATSLQKKIGGETYHFCSAECRDKFARPA